MAGGRLYETMQRHRAALLRHETDAARAMERAWMSVRGVVLQRLDVLLRQYQDALASGQPVRKSWLYETGRLKSLLATVDDEVSRFAVMAEQQTRAGQSQAVHSGNLDAQALLRATVPPDVSWTFNSAPAVETLVGFAGDGSPLRDLFDGFGAEASANVRRTLTSAVALGWNPRKIAGQVADDLNVSRARALTISRTETLRAYRAASIANYQANSDVVGQWMWSADKSVNTCGMCLAMDGTLHDLDETLDSHPNCRCSPVPVTKSWSDILSPLGVDTSDLEDTSIADSYQSGADWFDAQSDATQAAILGPAKAAAYAAGDLTLDDLVGVDHDPDWCVSRYEKSLKQLGLSQYGQKGAA